MTAFRANIAMLNALGSALEQRAFNSQAPKEIRDLVQLHADACRDAADALALQEQSLAVPADITPRSPGTS